MARQGPGGAVKARLRRRKAAGTGPGTEGPRSGAGLAWGVPPARFGASGTSYG